MGKAGVVVGIIIFIVLIAGLWSMYQGYNDAQEALAKGCVATTASWNGIPSSFSCPAGTELSWVK